MEKFYHMMQKFYHVIQKFYHMMEKFYHMIQKFYHMMQELDKVVQVFVRLFYSSTIIEPKNYLHLRSINLKPLAKIQIISQNNKT